MFHDASLLHLQYSEGMYLSLSCFICCPKSFIVTAFVIVYDLAPGGRALPLASRCQLPRSDDTSGWYVLLCCQVRDQYLRQSREEGIPSPPRILQLG